MKPENKLPRRADMVQIGGKPECIAKLVDGRKWDVYFLFHGMRVII